MKIFKAEPYQQGHSLDEQIGLVESLFIKPERQGPDFNRRMFNEDFSRLFNSINRRSGNLFEIVSNDDDLMQKLLGSVNTRSGRNNVDKSIREFVEEIANSLIWYGKSYFFLHEDKQQKNFHVSSFKPYGVMRLFRKYLQWVPKRLERHWDRDDEELPREVRILDAAKILRFDMPTPIKRMLSAQNMTLALLDKHQFGDINFHSLATHENPTPNNHFDFRVWRDSQDLALYRATRRTGWGGRKFDSTKHSDFFLCHRLIRFRRNQLLLRDDILNQLSGELSRVGKYYQAAFSVEISGTDKLPNVAYLRELESRLVREEVGFNEITDYCLKY